MAKDTRKGFVLIEAMVVLAFLATTLLSIYTSFNNVLDRTKKRLYYDDPIYLYRTYYLLNFLERNGLPQYINAKFINTSGTNDDLPDVLEFGCYSNYNEETGGTGTVNTISATSPLFCDQLRSKFEIEHIYIMHYDVNNVVGCALDMTNLGCERNASLRTFSNSAVDYLFTLDGFTTGEVTAANNLKFDSTYMSGYRIVVEYKKEKTTEYEHCVDLNCSRKERTPVTKSDYYFATLEIPYGANQSSNIQEYHTEM